MNIRIILIGTIWFFLLKITIAERWSRQISQTNENPVVDDWVPIASKFSQQPVSAATSAVESLALPQASDRSENGRVLAYPNFVGAASNNAPSTFNFVHPYQFQRFQHQKGGQQQLLHQPPTSQSFFKFEMPSFGADGTRDNSAPIQTGYQIQHTFGPVANSQPVLTQSLFNQKPAYQPEFHPIPQQPHHQQFTHSQAPRKPTRNNFVDENKEIKDSKTAAQQDFSAQQNPFSFQKPSSFQAQFPSNPFRQEQLTPSQGQLHSANVGQDEEVQLLYVPYDTLYNQRHENEQQIGFDNPKYNLVQEPVNPLQINNFYTQDPMEPIPEHNFNTPSTTSTTTSSTTFRPYTSTRKPEVTVHQFLNPRFTTQSPPKLKPKPHQPPLAMFYHKTTHRASPNDVVSALSSERTIAVLDAPAKQAPEVFIGPAGLLPPSGYTKFDLPYLSSFDHNNLDNNLQQTPFFVAPLSYKTPPGFSKLLLPEPHVGSVVVNKPVKTNEYIRDSTQRPFRPTQESFIPTGGIRYSSIPTSRPSTTSKIHTTSTPVTRWKIPNEQQNRVTQAPNDYYFNQYQQETIKEVSSPRTQQTSTHRHRRPTSTPTPTESAFTQTVKPYANFKPMPSNIGRDEYFKKQILTSTQALPPTTSTTTTTTTTTTTQAPTSSPQSYFTENFSRHPETTRQQFYDSSTAAPEIVHRFQSKPLFDDEYRMKQYFRQQDAFKNRQTSSTPPTIYEKIQYTPVSLDYGRPSSTPHYYEGSTLRTTTPNQRFTFYHPNGPSSSEENVESNTLPPNNNKNNFDTFSFERQSPVPEFTVKPLINRVQPTEESRLPANHRPTYDNEVTIYNHDEKTVDSVEFEPNPYNVPSELPPITPNLPGLVNALRENERLNAIEKETTDAITTTSSTLRPTRRPIGNRGRRPVLTKTSTSTSLSYSSSDDVTTRRPINRRRPYTTKNSTAEGTSSRAPTNRNKSRYNPTPEERKQFRIKNRGQHSTSSTKGNKVKTEEDNIDYQRDVLKQNYPVFKHPTRKPFFTTTEKTDEVITVTPNTLKDGFPGLLEPMQIAQQYQQQIQQDNFGPGYFPNEEELSPTESSRNEIKPVYTTSSTTSTTVTTDSYREEISKRPAFVRRPRPRTTTTTTTEFPVTTMESIEPQRYTIRPRTRPDGGNNNLPRKVIKIRARTRKPHPASTTDAPENNRNQKKDSNYQKVSRFNQDFYNNNEYKPEPTKRNQFRSKFNLEPQESQWSPSLLRKDTFKPVDPKENLKNIKIENEPDIITVGPQDTEKQDNFELNVSAGFGPSAKSYGSKDIKSTENKTDRRTEPTFEELLEEVMADIGREAAKKEEIPVKANLDNQQTGTKTVAKTSSDQLTNRNAKSTNKNDKAHRRGVWKKVRVQPADGFETAESQNIGAHLFNSITQKEKSVEIKEPEPTIALDNVDISEPQEYTTTVNAPTTTEKSKTITTTLSPEALTPETEIPYEIESKVETVTSISEEISRRVVSKKPTTTTQAPFPTTTTISPINAEITTTRFYNHDYEQEDNVGDVITRRIDDTISENYDLDTQPSLFDEVRSQLKDLFAAEEEDDVEYGDVVKPNFQPRKHEYTSIQRIRAVTTIPNANEDDKPETTTESLENAFHKNLMKNVVFATSTSTTVDRETEICYRGRCVKAQKQT